MKPFTANVGPSFGSVTEIEPGYLKGTIEIFGVRHHVELIEVVADPREFHTARNREWQDRLEDFHGFCDGRFETVSLDQREFVCVITPFCRG